MAIENLLPKSAKVKEMATDIDGANDVKSFFIVFHIILAAVFNKRFFNK